MIYIWGDFGCADQLKNIENESLGRFVGTLGYYAPELIKIDDDDDTNLKEGEVIDRTK